MEELLQKIKIPFSKYIPSQSQFDGNAAFSEHFLTPDFQIQLRKMFEYPDSQLDEDSHPYHIGLLRGAEQEYLTLISASDDPDLFYIFIIDDSALTPLLHNMNQVNLIEEEFYTMLGNLYDDFTIIDKHGVIEKALPNFEAMYGIPAEEAMGHTIFEMEERKIFNPCISAMVLKSGKKQTMMQLTKSGKYLMCISIPIFNRKGELEKIISYTRDMTQYERILQEYNSLKALADFYSQELKNLRQDQEKNTQFIGGSPEMRKIVHLVNKISRFDATVFLTGESGVGKSMLARMIHQKSSRESGPFISINCGAIPENLLESELFGYEKGSFTGAGREGKPGLVELAHQGTLFLDEIGDMPLHMQVKLLKVIQERKVAHVGGLNEKTVDFRLIAATNQDIKKRMEAGLFREDLYYRLNVISIHIPPLRHRREDIFQLVHYFTKKYNEHYGVNHVFSCKAIEYMEHYRWPGNIRELENVVERLVLTIDEYSITEDLLPYYIFSEEESPDIRTGNKTLKEILESVEKQVMLNSYKQYGSTTKVAQALGISQPSASVKLSKYLPKEKRKDET